MSKKRPKRDQAIPTSSANSPC